MSAVDTVTRDGIAKGLMEAGHTPGDAHEVADLVVHAVDEALATIAAVTKRASKPQNAIQAHVVALQLAASIIDQHAKASTSVARKLAESIGCPLVSIKVEA